MGSSGVSNAFRELADVLDAIDAKTQQDVEITTATPVEGDLLNTDTVSVSVGVQLPFLDESLEEAAPTRTLTPTDVRLTETGALEIDLQATVSQSDGSDAASHNDEPTTRHNDQPTTIEDSETDPKANATRTQGTTDQEYLDETPTNTSDTAPETNSTQHDQTTPQSGQGQPSEDTTHEQASTADTQAVAEESTTQSTASSTTPAYQDPEQLKAVYEEYDTFAEMTDALDVEVTPQTVRRYMIEYEIHEPASTTGSRLAESLLEADSESLATTQDTATEDAPTTAASSSPTNDVDDRENQSREANSDGEDSGETEEPRETPTGTSETQNSDFESEQDEPPSDTPPETDTTTSQSDSSEETATLDTQALEAMVEDELPEQVTLKDVTETARTAQTLYDAQQHLDMDRERVRTLLQELNLLDFVHQRVANRPPQRPPKEEIEERIKNSVTAEHDMASDSTSPAQV